MECPIEDMRYFVYGVIKHAISCVQKHQPKDISYEDWKAQSVLAKLPFCLLPYLAERKK